MGQNWSPTGSLKGFPGTLLVQSFLEVVECGTAQGSADNARGRDGTPGWLQGWTHRNFISHVVSWASGHSSLCTNTSGDCQTRDQLCWKQPGGLVNTTPNSNFKEEMITSSQSRYDEVTLKKWHWNQAGSRLQKPPTARGLHPKCQCSSKTGITFKH